MTAGRPPQTKSLSWFGTSRITLGPDALLVEGRDPFTGFWAPTRQIFYDEIAAVYTYRVYDWGYLLAGLVYALLGGLILFIVWIASGSAQDGSWGWTIALLGIFLLALSVYRIAIVRRPMIRIESVTGPYAFSSRQPEFVAQLLQRLPLPHSRRPEAAPMPAGGFAGPQGAAVPPPAPTSVPAPAMPGPLGAAVPPPQMTAGAEGTPVPELPLAPEAGRAAEEPAREEAAAANESRWEWRPAEEQAQEPGQTTDREAGGSVG